jgi:hypothetical protein
MAQELSGLAARLEEARSGIARLARSRERVQAQTTVLEQQEAQLERQAAVARQFGREDIARVARSRLQDAQSRRAELAVQLSQLLGEEAELISAAPVAGGEGSDLLKTGPIIGWPGRAIRLWVSSCVNHRG